MAGAESLVVLWSWYEPRDIFLLDPNFYRFRALAKLPRVQINTPLVIGDGTNCKMLALDIAQDRVEEYTADEGLFEELGNMWRKEAVKSAAATQVTVAR